MNRNIVQNMMLLFLPLFDSYSSQKRDYFSDKVAQFDSVYAAVESSDLEPARAGVEKQREDFLFYCSTQALSYDSLSVSELRLLLDSCKDNLRSTTRNILEGRISELVDLSSSFDFVIRQQPEPISQATYNHIQSCYQRAEASEGLNSTDLVVLLDDCEPVFTNSVQLRIIGKKMRLDQD